MRFGTPMYSPAQDCYCYVTIEREGQDPQIKRWKGRNLKSIKRAAREKYQGASLQFGSPFYITR